MMSPKIGTTKAGIKIKPTNIMTETITTSSLIEKFSYEEAQQVLHIHFRRGGHYGYTSVTPEEFASFREAESHGKHFLQIIKPTKQFSKF